MKHSSRWILVVLVVLCSGVSCQNGAWGPQPCFAPKGCERIPVNR
jgi:hypothetical protein